VELALEGFEARVFQHELDHLEGILFVDRIEPAEKILVRKKLKKLEERFARNRAAH
jgi:peptide deformylase